HSERPWKMHTVPRRPAGGSQRAKRRVMPSGVLSVPATKLSGTGFAGIEMSFMKTFGRAAVASAYNSMEMLLNLSGRKRVPLPQPGLALWFAPNCIAVNLVAKTMSYLHLQGRNSDPI